MKNVLLLAAVVALSFQAQAQDKVKFGAKAGVNLSTLSSVSKAKMLPGYYVGAVAAFKLTDKFSVQPELVYSSQGAKNDYNVTEGSVTSHHHNHDKLDYINIPLLAKYFITESFSVEVGPQLGFLVQANSKDKVTIGDTEKQVDRDFKDEVKSFDIAIGAGLSYKLYDRFFVNGRYNLGLSNVGTSNEYYSNSKNGVTQLGLGFTF